MAMNIKDLHWPRSAKPEELAQWMNQHLGSTNMERIRMVITHLSPEKGVAEMPVQDDVRTLVGPVHTGAMISLADSIATFHAMVAYNRDTSKEVKFPVAIGLSAQIVGNISEGNLRAESFITHLGRTLITVDTRVTSVETTGKLLALVQTTHFIRS